MTWRKSFFKLTLHDMKKRSWCTALLFLIQFFVIPVSALLTVQDYQSGYGGIGQDYQAAAEELFERYIFDFGKMGSVFFLIVGAVLLAMTGFSYLNSKKKVDFIHSMPVKREILFLSRYLAGFLLYVAPLLINVGIGLLAAFMTKGCNLYVVKNAFAFLLYHLVYFLLFYSTSILAIVLIGNLVVSFLGIGVLYAYQTVMWFILVTFKENFYQTYMRVYDTFKAYDPVGLLIRQIISFNYNYFSFDYRGNRIRMETESYYSTGWEVCLIALLIAVVTGVLALVLFRIRKSEAAGKSLVFPKLEPFVKAALLLPSGLIGGLVLYVIASGYKKLWYIFGSIVFFFLAAAVIEIIFRQDFKSLLKHKLSAAAGAGCILLVTLCFWMDMLGFDSRIPKTGGIESVGISIPDAESQAGFYNTFSDMEYYDYTASASPMQRIVRLYAGNIEKEAANGVLYNCKITGGEEIEKVCALAEYYVNHKTEFKKQMPELYEDKMQEWTETETVEDVTEGEMSERYLECQVEYRLKNGKSVYRSYQMPYGKELLEVLEPVFANEGYKKAAFPVFQDEINYRYLDISDMFVDQYKQIGRDDKTELLECYRKDREKLTFQTVWEENLSGYFSMINTLGSKSSVTCNVYESDDNTVNWLKEHGIVLARLDEIEVLSAKLFYEAKDGRYAEEDLKGEQKENILPYLIRYDFIAPQQKFILEQNPHVVLEYTVKQKGESNITWNGDYQDELGGGEAEVRTADYFLKTIPPYIQENLPIRQ